MALLSRVAESLFWIGRYAERAENTARLLSVTFFGRLERRAPEVAGASNTWAALLSTLGLDDDFTQVTGEPATAPAEAGVVEFLALQVENPSSVVGSLLRARENARSVRDFLSSEAWIAINRAYRNASAARTTDIAADGLYDFCEGVLSSVNAFHGTLDGTSLHDEGWQWYSAGVALERADMVTRIVDAKYHLLLGTPDEVGGAEDRYQWAALLRSVSGWEAYRRLHPEGIDPAQVTEFLLLDPQFPRSLRAAVDVLQRALEAGTQAADPALRNPPLRAVAALQSRLRYQSAPALIRAGLHESMDDIQVDLHLIMRGIGEAFFRWEPHAA